MLGTSGYEYLKKIPYPTSRRSTVVKDRPKLVGNDYEVVKEVNDYQEALYTYANIPGIPDYVNISESENPPIKNNTTDDEDLYIDPGHCPVALRKCFENKKHWMINKNDIRLGLIQTSIHLCWSIVFYRSLDQVNLEWLILAYGLMVLLILYK